jgi:hypothetical protein
VMRSGAVSSDGMTWGVVRCTVKGWHAVGGIVSVTAIRPFLSMYDSSS